MFGAWLEKLKDPKNPISTILAGWVFCIVGYIILRKWTVPLVANIFAFIGLFMIAITTVRLSVTKLAYAAICGVLVLSYAGLYSREKRWEPRNKPKIAVYAPAMMVNALFVGKIKGQSTYVDGLPWQENLDAENLELRESIEANK